MNIINRFIQRLTLYQCRYFGHKRPGWAKVARLLGEVVLCERCLAAIELKEK